MSTTFAYIRVSTNDQSLSVSAQKQRVKAYCSLYGIEIPEENFLVDEGWSGKNLKRPMMQKLLTDPSVSGVVVASLDRLTRSVVDLGELLATFKGKRLISVQEQFDVSTPHGEFALNLMVSVAQLERKTIALRVTNALAEKRRKGERLGGRAPFGFICAGTGFAEDPELAPLRAWILEQKREGSTLKAIVSRASQEGRSNRGRALTYAVVQAVCKAA